MNTYICPVAELVLVIRFPTIRRKATKEGKRKGHERTNITLLAVFQDNSR